MLLIAGFFLLDFYFVMSFDLCCFYFVFGFGVLLL